LDFWSVVLNSQKIAMSGIAVLPHALLKHVEVRITVMSMECRPVKQQ